MPIGGMILTGTGMSPQKEGANNFHYENSRLVGADISRTDRSTVKVDFRGGMAICRNGYVNYEGRRQGLSEY